VGVGVGQSVLLHDPNSPMAAVPPAERALGTPAQPIAP
jgi:hypothetical protein